MKASIPLNKVNDTIAADAIAIINRTAIEADTLLAKDKNFDQVAWFAGNDG